MLQTEKFQKFPDGSVSFNVSYTDGTGRVRTFPVSKRNIREAHLHLCDIARDLIIVNLQCLARLSKIYTVPQPVIPENLYRYDYGSLLCEIDPLLNRIKDFGPKREVTDWLAYYRANLIEAAAALKKTLKILNPKK